MKDILILTLCIIPSLILLWYVYIKDKIEKEPLYLLILLFLGGVIGCISSITISALFKKWLSFLDLSYSSMNIFQIIFKLLFTIAIVEEGIKWLVNYVTIWHNKNFNHIYDPIVYATFVALGFATLENIIYGFTFRSHGFVPIIMRGIISVPSHAVFGVFMGYYLGISKNAIESSKPKQSRKYCILSVIVPIILHFIYDLLLIKETFITYALFTIYIISLYILSYFKIKKLSSLPKLFT